MEITEKSILVTMPDKSVWKVRAETVVVDRAKYYANQEKGGRTYEEVFDEEYRTGMSDNDEILDWAANNMDWEDVKFGAKKLPQPEQQLTPLEFQEGWVNGDKRVVEEKIAIS